MDDAERLAALERLPGYWRGRLATREQLDQELRGALDGMFIPPPPKPTGESNLLSADFAKPMNLSAAMWGAVRQEIARNERVMHEYRQRMETLDGRAPPAPL